MSQVSIRHPEIDEYPDGVYPKVERFQFEEVWQGHGWLVVNDEADPTELEGKKVAELRALVEERGLDVPSGAKKQDLIDALSAVDTDEEV